MSEEEAPTTQELRIAQTARERTERKEAERATTEADEAAHERRADKAAYLKEKLDEQERSDRA